jgi:para-aminobenzoate synthetase/4-amino-4-deoxychorismate lyase
MAPPFELLETLRWTPDEGYFLLERHLERLRGSARHFRYPCPPGRVDAALAAAVAGAAAPRRVRLLVNEDGVVRAEQAALEPAAGPVRVGLAAGPIDSSDPFLFHKTTHREHLERERRAGVDDTALWNERREITETIIANLVVELDGRRVTPPIACGLLPGTMRAELLARGEIVEAPIQVDQFLAATKIWAINSVRGWRELVVV